MKWVVSIAGLVAAAIALVFISGLLLPRKHVASRRARYRAHPEEIWKVLVDPASFPEWRKDIAAVEILQASEGRPRWRETTRFGKIPFERAEAEEPRRLVVRITDPDLPFGGLWTYEIEPAGTGSVLTITEEGEIRNPAFRLLSRIGGQSRTIEGVLRALGMRFEEDVTPEPAEGEQGRPDPDSPAP
jgi:uncharacterized protein YndB with AHSA1/START domain